MNMTPLKHIAIIAFFFSSISFANEPISFFRFASTTTSHINITTPDGALSWSNAATMITGRFQRAESLSPSITWNDYIYCAITDTVMSIRLIDPNSPSDMAFIPAGHFLMGTDTNIFPSDPANSNTERPQHSVYVSAFYMDKYEVSQALWDEVKLWAATNGYLFENPGGGYATNHPVAYINWYDAVKWCNARSERDGLAVCYTTNGATYKTGNNSNVVCNWTANGYRLPTEAEWEKAARGGAQNSRFPWIDYTNRISHAKANYNSVWIDGAPYYDYDLGPTEGQHPDYKTSHTSPVGAFGPNGYGLYDMAGNQIEWCWDWYQSDYYAISPSTDPRGPNSGSGKVRRGGSWHFNVPVRCASRSGWWDYPQSEALDYGFRCARSPQ